VYDEERKKQQHVNKSVSHDARERNVEQYFFVLCNDDLLMMVQDKTQLHNLLSYFMKKNLVVLRNIFENL